MVKSIDSSSLLLNDSSRVIGEAQNFKAHGHTWTVGEVIDAVLSALVQAFMSLFGNSNKSEETGKNSTLKDRGVAIPPQMPLSPETEIGLAALNRRLAMAKRQPEATPMGQPSEDPWGVMSLTPPWKRK